MKKLEIILSQAIDEDFSRLCEVREVGQHFTKSVGVMGKGNTIPKMADDTWPQENVHYMMIVDDDEVESIRQIVESQGSSPTANLSEKGSLHHGREAGRLPAFRIPPASGRLPSCRTTPYEKTKRKKSFSFPESMHSH